MKRTGIKKLELKRLTVKQLSEVSGAGHRITNMTISGTCTCTTTDECAVEFDAGFDGCDLETFGRCDGSCHAPPPPSCSSCSSCSGGSSCGSCSGQNMEMNMY